MRRFAVDEVLPAPGAEPALGRLGPALERWAAQQGAWPPQPPQQVRSHVVTDDEPGDLDAGVRLADGLADAGVDLLVVGARGAAVPGTVAAAALLRLEPVRAVGTSAGAGAWAARAVGVRDGLRAVRGLQHEPAALLDALGSRPLSLLTGLLAQAAVRRTPVLLDGSAGVAGAALLAERLAPGASSWWLAGQAPVVPAAAAALTEVGLVPLLDLALDRPEGADLALAVLLRALVLVGTGGDPAHG